MTESSLQIIGVIVSVTAMLGWLIKSVIGYFISSNNEKSAYIEKLVASNQTNTENFINTINHQRTMDREMQGKIKDSLDKLSAEISNSNEVNKTLIGYLKK